MGYGRDASCCERECLGALRGGVVSHGRISVLRRRQVIAAAAAADALPLLSDVAHDASSDDSGDESKGTAPLCSPHSRWEGPILSGQQGQIKEHHILSYPSK